MKKVSIPPLLIKSALDLNLHIAQFEYEQTTQTLYILFPLARPGEMVGKSDSLMQKQASAIQQLVTQFDPNTTAKAVGGNLCCRIPTVDLNKFQQWLAAHTAPENKALIEEYIKELTSSGEKSFQPPDKGNASKPIQGIYSTELVIGTLQQESCLHQTATALKTKTQSEYIFKKELIAELEAFHGELCRLIMSPAYAPKVRSVHDPLNDKPIGVLSKKVMNFISLFDLLNLHDKILEVKELIEIGFVRLISYAYAIEENDLHTDNYGIDRKLDENKKLKPGTRIAKLDPGFSSYTLINCALKIYGLPPIESARYSRAFGRTVKPEEAFPIDPRDIAALPQLHKATPLNWPYHTDRAIASNLSFEEKIEKKATINVDKLNQDANFKRELYQHFLKIILISASILHSLGKAFISDSNILVKKYGIGFVEKITPEFLDTAEFKQYSKNEEYKKALLCTLYVNHYTARFQALRNVLINMPEFRANLIRYDESYIHNILREFQEYNDQFCANDRTSKEEIIDLQRFDDEFVQVQYKKKHLQRLINFEEIHKDFSEIRSQAIQKDKQFKKDFIHNLHTYFQNHTWDVGFQLIKKTIPDERGAEKVVPTCVYEQAAEIQKYRTGVQNLDQTIERILEIGEQAYFKSSNSSEDSKTYYKLFNGRNLEKITQGIPHFETKPLDDDFVNLCLN